MEHFLTKKRVAFTGHRPEKLGISEEEAKEKLALAIDSAISDGYLVFITGMARGIDMWAGEIVLDRKKTNDGIKLVCASPYENFEKSWSDVERARYRSIMEKADFVKFVSPHYSRGCFQIRNEYMVDRASRVISAYNGEKGGTRNTILYAKKKGVEVVNILEK